MIDAGHTHENHERMLRSLITTTGRDSFNIVTR